MVIYLAFQAVLQFLCSIGAKLYPFKSIWLTLHHVKFLEAKAKQMVSAGFDLLQCKYYVDCSLTVVYCSISSFHRNNKHQVNITSVKDPLPSVQTFNLELVVV